MPKKDTMANVRALLSSAPPPPPRDPEPQVHPADPEQWDDTAAAAEVTAAVEEVPAPPPAPVPVPRKPATPRPKPTPPVEVQTDASMRLTQPKIPSQLFERVRAAKDASGDTHETWFLDAYDAVSEQLDEVYRPGPARRTTMPMRRRRTRRPTGDPLVSYPLRLTAEEIAVLEERAAQLQPPSMADMITAIVKLRLDQLGG